MADDELDGVKIRRLATMRRATWRSRSYAIIVAVACAVLAVQFLWMCFQDLRALGLHTRPMMHGLLAILAGWGAWHFMQRAIAMHREARTAIPADPNSPPDFSTLSDGSQQAKNLENVE